MIGRSSWVDSLFVWFPVALVIDALREKSCMYTQSVSQLGAVAFTDRSQVELPEAQDFFLVLMPCALKAQTVIKTYCL